MRLAWLTDIHLNFAPPRAFDELCESIEEARADVVLIGGDIGEAPDVVYYLKALDMRLERPIHFVLGNHDYYDGAGIAEVRRMIAETCLECPRLTWLSEAGVVHLTDRTALVGHDGWADGRLGDFRRSGVVLNDYRLIPDLAGLDTTARLDRLQALGDEAAGALRAALPEALASHERTIVLTHVPPFREACWHEGGISNDEWLPHFSCAAVGDALRDAIAPHPDRAVLVLCGHTHGSGEVDILPNLKVWTGAAEYGRPTLQRVVEVD